MTVVRSDKASTTSFLLFFKETYDFRARYNTLFIMRAKIKFSLSACFFIINSAAFLPAREAHGSPPGSICHCDASEAFLTPAILLPAILGSLRGGRLYAINSPFSLPKKRL